MITVVTQCDMNYTSRAIALIESLLYGSTQVEIKIITHDDSSSESLRLYFGERIEVIALSDLIYAYPKIETARDNRSYAEYFFLITPFLIKYLQEFKNIKEVWYVDADIRFYGDISELQKDTKLSDITLTSHNFPAKLNHLEKFGKYNVGIMYISGSSISKEVVSWWSTKCLESTSLDISTGVYGDQKYLDDFEIEGINLTTFSGVGANAAPWNCSTVTTYGKSLICSDNSKLISYHFSGLRIGRHYSILGYFKYKWTPSAGLKDLVFRPYVNSLKEIDTSIRRKSFKFSKKIKFKELVRILMYRDIIKN